MISPGDLYVRLELMHLLSVVVDGSSFRTHVLPKKGHTTSCTFITLRIHHDIFGSTRGTTHNDVRHCQLSHRFPFLCRDSSGILMISKKKGVK